MIIPGCSHAAKPLVEHYHNWVKHQGCKGPAKQICLDCGTNLIEACQIRFTDPHKSKVTRYHSEEDCSWGFNPPQVSHVGVAWQQMIGMCLVMLDSILQQITPSHLMHVLSTLMAKVTGMINSRPFYPILTEPESHFLLTPAILLTKKACTLLPPTGEFKEFIIHRQQWSKVQHSRDRKSKRLNSSNIQK